MPTKLNNVLQQHPDLVAQLLEAEVGVSILLLDADLQIIDCNQTFMRLIHAEGSKALGRVTEYLDAPSQKRFADTLHTQDCMPLCFCIRNSMEVVMDCRILQHQDTKILLGKIPVINGDQGMAMLVELNLELAAMQREMTRKQKEIERARAKIKTLHGLIPICANCKKVRTNDGYWEQVEKYVTERSAAKFSHSLCENCVTELYPDVKLDINKAG